jgi:voltage-gated potassium channel
VRAWRWLEWVLVAFTLIAIPAFYVELVLAAPGGLAVGRALHMCMSVGFVVSLGWAAGLSRKPKQFLLQLTRERRSATSMIR